MSTYHPMITIEIAKSYCIQKYATKSTNEINTKIRELSEDKTNWSKKVLDEVKKIIEENHYNLPIDIFEVHKNRAKVLKYQFDENVLKNTNNIINAAHNELENDKGTATEVINTTLINNIKYSEFNDVEMAQLILLLSQLIKKADKLWVTISIIIKELGTNVTLYFKNDGHIEVSKRSKMIFSNNEYIKTLNDLIDKKREVPIFV